MSKARDIANAGTALATVDPTELGYLDGVTSNIQTQVDAKIAKTLTTTTGDIIYASGANTPARLAVGSTDDVLTVAGGVPTWAAPASGGMTVLSSGSLSGASVTISSISASYNNLQLVITNALPSAQAGLRVRFNSDSGSNYFSVNSSLGGTSQTYGSTYATVSSDQHTSGTNLSVLDVYDYANTSSRKLCNANSITQNNATPNYNLVNYRGSWNDTSAINAITILFYSGTISSGSYVLYGVK